MEVTTAPPDCIAVSQDLYPARSTALACYQVDLAVCILITGAAVCFWKRFLVSQACLECLILLLLLPKYWDCGWHHHASFIVCFKVKYLSVRCTSVISAPGRHSQENCPQVWGCPGIHGSRPTRATYQDRVSESLNKPARRFSR